MAWHIYNQLITVSINRFTSKCNLTRKSNTTKKLPNSGNRNRASPYKCKTNQKVLIVVKKKKTKHTIQKIRRQRAPDVPLHGADESRKPTDAWRTTTESFSKASRWAKRNKPAQIQYHRAQKFGGLELRAWASGTVEGQKQRESVNEEDMSYTERLGACNHVRKNRHRAPDSTKAGALEL